MFCKYCGHELADEAIACTACGRPTDNYIQRVIPAQPARAEIKLNGLAIGGFVTALLSIWLGALVCAVSAAGVILCSIALKMRRRYNSCNGLAIAGLVISIITLVVWFFVFFGIFAACVF